MIYLRQGAMLQNPPFPKQDAHRLFKSAICQSFRSVSFWMVLVKGDALNQSIILGVRCILLHFALVIEDGLFLRNKGINSINMYHSSQWRGIYKGTCHDLEGHTAHVSWKHHPWEQQNQWTISSCTSQKRLKSVDSKKQINLGQLFSLS